MRPATQPGVPPSALRRNIVAFLVRAGVLQRVSMGCLPLVALAMALLIGFDVGHLRTQGRVFDSFSVALALYVGAVVVGCVVWLRHRYMSEWNRGEPRGRWVK